MFLTTIYLRLQALHKSGPALSARRVSSKCMKKNTRGRKLLEGTKKKMHCEYVGTELSLKRGKTGLRADVFGISTDGENPHKNRP